MAMRQDVLTLCWPNRVDQGSLSGGSWRAALPLNNLKNRVIARKARSTTAAAAHSQFSLALDSARPICAVALAGHNLTASATWRVRLYSDYAQTALLFDSGIVSVWPASYVNEQLEWEDNGFWLGNDTLDVAADFTPLAVLFTDDIVSGVRSVKVELIDTLNAAGYIEAGRLFVSTAWQPAINMDYGVSFGYLNSTAVETARDGTEYFDRRRQRRTMNFRLSGLNPTEAFSGIYAMQRDIGIDGEFLIACELAASEQFYYRTFLARLQELDALTEPYLDRYSVPMQAREIL